MEDAGNNVMAKPEVTMYRRGVFACPGLVPNRKCGPDEVRAFNFETWITCTDLDGNGFVADNFAVMKRINEKYAAGKWEASCEDFAGGLIYLMRGLCPRATKIVARIHPIGDAHLTVKWRTGMPMPSFFPKRLDSPARNSVRKAKVKV